MIIKSASEVLSPKPAPNWLHWPQIKKLVSVFGNDQLRFVGGAVRDAVLGIEAGEIDAATTMPPDAVISLLEKAGIRAIPTGIAHGTITAVIDGKSFEITSLRRDTACDGRHAEVAFGTDWREDAARRDFTINAMYLSASGELFDYFGGVADARAGRVRFIGDAKIRVQEDYLRILRFFRFYAAYGKGDADMQALSACREFANHINGISGERIQHEMLKLLAAPAPFSALALMQECGVFEQVCDFAYQKPQFAQQNIAFRCTNMQFRHTNMQAIDTLPDTISRLAFLLLNADIAATEALEKIAKRWKISNALYKKLSLLINNIDEISPAISLAEQKHLIRKFGAKNFTEIVILQSAIAPHELYQAMLKFAQNWPIPTFPITGDDLIKAGISTGKPLGDKLRTLEIIWENSDYSMNKEELLKFI